jgi:diguanylate cyclase (GGDEF)-like protein
VRAGACVAAAGVGAVGRGCGVDTAIVRGGAGVGTTAGGATLFAAGGGGASTTVRCAGSETARSPGTAVSGASNCIGTVASVPIARASITPLVMETSFGLMEMPLLADKGTIGQPEGVLKGRVQSFKVKLAAYFALISLLPLAAAFWGFDAVTERSETDRADSVLQAGLRSALANYSDELQRLERTASETARDREFQRALAAQDAPAIRRALGNSPNLRVEGRGLRVGRRPPLAGERWVEVKGEQGRLGSVVASLPFDDVLVARLKRQSGLDADHRLLFLSGGRVVAGDADTNDRLELTGGEPKTASLGGQRYRLLASEPLPAPRGAQVAILTPQGRIDAAVTSTEGRVFVPLLIALVLIALLAYLEGRSIVRTLGGLVGAAHGIARGELRERVPVRGRDEFAQLGQAFNEMADQLQARLRELDAERTRVRDATMRFGEALAATHDPEELLRVIVDTAVVATGATGAYLAGGDVYVSAGDVDTAGERLGVPVTAGHESFGTLVLIGEGFGEDQRETANWLVGHAAIALANVRRHKTVEKQALVDPLTGLANRRLAEGALDTELARAGRFDEPLALLMADLDDFKRINDRWGHPFGDEVLREFAAALSHSIREIDLAGRWGGEEFAVVLPGTDLEGGAALAERIRNHLLTRSVTAPDGERVRVTASFGLAAYPDVRSKDELVAAADAALYEAKRAGKDRVFRAEVLDEPPTRVA